MTIAGPRAVSRPLIGADLPTPDAIERVVGTLRYTVDHSVDGMAHGRLVLSPYPHATIEGIDMTEAGRMEGVIAVLTGEDIVRSEHVPNPSFGLVRRDQRPLAVGKVRYAGEPVVLVVADTASHARRAAAAVMIDYVELPYVVHPADASGSDAPVIHEEWPGNGCGDWGLHLGDVDSAMTEAARVIESVYSSPPASQVPFEPLVALARWEAQRLEIWTATQWPSAVQRELAHVFNLSQTGVRVRTFPLGGGYGGKSQVKIEPLVAAAARILGVPVRLELDRDEVFLTTCKHSAEIRIRTGVDEGGRFLARDIDLVYNAGAYAIMTPKAVAQGLVRSPGPYVIPNVRIRSQGVYTNTVPSGSFRGAMTNQPAFAYESHTDEIASTLGMDPLALRRANLLRDGDTYATGESLHDIHFLELIENVAEAIGWDDSSRPAEAGRARGKGLGVILKTSPPGTRSEVTLELSSDGRLIVYSSSVDMGQGLRGTLAQLAAHHFGVAFEKVRVVDPDTSVTGFDSMTAGSRSTFSSGFAIREASQSLRGQLIRLASEQLRMPSDELSHEAGNIVSASDPNTRSSYTEVLQKAGLASLVAEGIYQSDPSTAFDDPGAIRGQTSVHWHQGAVAVELEVDLETGKVELLRCHGAAWAGKIVNPTRARQQSEGSIIFGIGPALFEELSIVDGQVTNPNFADYQIPSIADIPWELTSSTLESDSEDAEIHGVGEMTIPAVAPAIANAIAHATGARIRDLPLTAERVLRAILEGGGASL